MEYIPSQSRWAKGTGYFSGMMFMDVIVILGLNLPWLLVSLLLSTRLWKDHPISRKVQA